MSLAPHVLDIIPGARLRWNLGDAALYEEAVKRGEGLIAEGGPLACLTGQHTGRSPNDRFLVREPSSEHEIAWGAVNRPMEPAQFDLLHQDLLKALEGAELFVQERSAGADPEFSLPIRVVNEHAWHSLRAVYVRPDPDPPAAASLEPRFTVIDSPSFKAQPERHGTKSETVIAVNFAKRLVLIGGSSYAGEVKKSIFSTLNYLLPARGVLPMHCSANVGTSGDVALFFGLSGTGKTTLSSDPERKLIGDDEHGWTDGACSTEGGATQRRFGCRRRPSRRFLPPPAGSARFSRTSSRTWKRGRSIWTTTDIRRTRADPILSRSSRTRYRQGRPAIRRTSSC
jgi:phosphoenolpyruvate carboxykinase (ATP)